MSKVASKSFCPVDGSELHHTGDHGIVDYDGNWDAQASRYECADGKHTVFVTDSVVSPWDLPFISAENEVIYSLRTANWNLEAKTVRLKAFKKESGYEDPLKSLEDLRSELAKRAVTSFKNAADEGPDDPDFGYEEYEFVHALEDVDDILEDSEFKEQLKEMGWLEEK